ncbi:Queuine tRNA-ribosyltransferase [subsurface metagenome]
MNDFSLVQTCPDSSARAGELITPHGLVPTPVFLPVGSQGSVKTLTPDEVRDIGVKMVLANTYHLYLRPGIELVEKMGGLHKFMAWDGAILTDSGGFQLFSLAPLCRVSDEGVLFRSHIDGSEHFMTPELAIKFQEALGADIIMVLDECPSHDAGFEKVQQAMVRTHQWAKRCLKAHKRRDQALYAIVQGGLFPQLRQQSAEELTSLDFSGYAIGGLSLGEPKQVTLDIVEETAALLPESKPRYLMGVGSPEDIVEGVARGIDIFDSVLPTRVARNGALFTWNGRQNIRNASFSQMNEPVVPGCGCYTCRSFSAAYLQHLFKSGELLAYRLATIHNLHFINNLVLKIRSAILDGTFNAFRRDFLSGYQPADEQTRFNQKQKWLRAKGRGG